MALAFVTEFGITLLAISATSYLAGIIVPMAERHIFCDARKERD